VLDMVILGLVQGLTEFLPVSSTAHLIFAETFLGIARPGILLEAILHLGTALAAIILFWGDVRLLLAGWWATTPLGRRTDALRPYGRVAWLMNRCSSWARHLTMPHSAFQCYLLRE